MPAVVEHLFPDVLRFAGEQGFAEAEAISVHPRVGLDVIRREIEQIIPDFQPKVNLYVCVGKFSRVQTELQHYRVLAERTASLRILGEMDTPLEDTPGITLVPVSPPRLARDYFCLAIGTEYMAGLLAGEIPGESEDDALRRYNTLLTYEPRLLDRALEGINSLLADVNISPAPPLSGFEAPGADSARLRTRTLLANRLAARISNLARQVQRSASRDALTGLENQERFYDSLLHEANRFNRSQRTFSVMRVDIVEEKEGAGFISRVRDEAVRGLGEVLIDVLRKGTDTAYKLAGNEFGLILEETNDKQAARVALRIEESFRKLRLPGTKLKIGVSAFASVKAVKELMEQARRRQREGG